MPPRDQTANDRSQISKEEAERVGEGIKGAILESVKDTFTESLKKMGTINPRISIPKSGASILNPGKIFDQTLEEAIMATGRQHFLEPDDGYFDNVLREARRRLERLPERHREFLSPQFFF